MSKEFDVVRDAPETPEQAMAVLESWAGNLAVTFSRERYELVLEALKKKEPMSWPCVIETADFEKDTVTLKMRCRDYKISAGPHWLSTHPQPKQEPVGKKICSICGYVGVKTDSVGQCPKCHWDELLSVGDSSVRSALNAMLTQFGMDEDEWNKPIFDQARKALATPQQPKQEPLPNEQVFDLAEIAWRHGWASCRDAERIGDEAEDARWGEIGAEVVQDITAHIKEGGAA
ncbi:hypothetical protein [Limnohabitans sp.]|uniref:hypothetical protein n=1 Tax=Limnohabitans sp. TaxID=1907725 RepID=UPI00286EB676|nr:hypothetical protein [Limnohabitans sp.]